LIRAFFGKKMKVKLIVKQKLTKISTSWYLWIFPAIALVICVWFYAQYLHQRGPTIQILFDDASGIQANKTKVRYRGVTIGLVKQISISSENEKKVIATVDLQKEASDFAVAGARFWMVIPDVKLDGITGLETLFEGTYISALPGKSDAENKFEFKGLIGGQSNDPLEDTVSFTLETGDAGSVGHGDSVTFRGVAVGSVTKTSLSKTSQVVVIQINIQRKYAHLIRTNTVFWRKLAFQANLGLFHSEIKLGAMDTVLHGGVEFTTPSTPGSIAKSQAAFPLFDTRPKDSQGWSAKLD
jgi:paraquat-inducible protein B